MRTENSRGIFQHCVQSVVGVFKLLGKQACTQLSTRTSQDENVSHLWCWLLLCHSLLPSGLHSHSSKHWSWKIKLQITFWLILESSRKTQQLFNRNCLKQCNPPKLQNYLLQNVCLCLLIREHSEYFWNILNLFKRATGWENNKNT